MKTGFGLGITSALCLFGLTLCNGGSGLPAFAETTIGSVRRVSIPEATGQTGAQPVLIELSPGYGVNISFIPTNEIVEKVWLDNLSFATLDVDGCLSGLGGGGRQQLSQQQGQNCQASGATVLHLRRINPVDFPNLPKTNSTLLTAIARGPAGRRVYLFRVVAGGKKPQYLTVEVTQPATTAPSTTAYRPIVQAAYDWQTFNRGLAVAEQKRLIRRGQPLWNRIQNFLVKVRAGEQIESAATTSGISLNLVKRLQELSSTGISAPSDVSPTLNTPNSSPNLLPQAG